VMRPDLTAVITSVTEQVRSERQTKKLTVRSRSSTLLGSSGGLLATSGALLHVHIHATSGFGFGDEDLSSLLENAGTVLDGIKGLVEVAGNS
jgi:hypothetical protein